MTRASQQLADWKPRAVTVSQDVRAALATMPAEDLLRLRAIARLRARSLPAGMSWSDLLHEAVLRALAGTRPWPPGVPLVAFLAGVMRSLCDEQLRRRRLQDSLPALEPTNATILNGRLRRRRRSPPSTCCSPRTRWQPRSLLAC